MERELSVKKEIKATIDKEGDKLSFSYELPHFDYSMDELEEYRKKFGCSEELACRSVLVTIATRFARMLLQYSEAIDHGAVKVSIPE